MYFFKNLLLYSEAWFTQTKCETVITKEGSMLIVNFMTPMGSLAWPYKSYSKNALFHYKIFFSTLGHGSDKLKKPGICYT